MLGTTSAIPVLKSSKCSPCSLQKDEWVWVCSPEMGLTVFSSSQNLGSLQLHGAGGRAIFLSLGCCHTQSCIKLRAETCSSCSPKNPCNKGRGMKLGKNTLKKLRLARVNCSTPVCACRASTEAGRQWGSSTAQGNLFRFLRSVHLLRWKGQIPTPAAHYSTICFSVVLCAFVTLTQVKQHPFKLG